MYIKVNKSLCIPTIIILILFNIIYFRTILLLLFLYMNVIIDVIILLYSKYEFLN